MFAVRRIVPEIRSLKRYCRIIQFGGYLRGRTDQLVELLKVHKNCVRNGAKFYISLSPINPWKALPGPCVYRSVRPSGAPDEYVDWDVRYARRLAPRSGRITIMRFRPANSRVINRPDDGLRRRYCFRLAREKQRNPTPRMYLTGSSISEVKPQCDLNDARGPVTQARSRTQDLAKCRAQDIGVWVGEFGVIKEIEKIPA